MTLSGGAVAEPVAWRRHEDGRVYVTLASAEPVVVRAVSRSALRMDERAQIERLADVTWRGDALELRRNRAHRVGRVATSSTVVTVPPPMDAGQFTAFYLFASGASLDKDVFARAAKTAVDRPTRDDLFLRLLAHLMVAVAARLLEKRIARRYRPVTERLHVLRGRPQWVADFGGHPSSGITCRHHILDTENALNGLVHAGVAAAVALLVGEPAWSKAKDVAHVWSELAKPAHATPWAFSTAEQRIDRLTEHYRPALALARSLTLGFAPQDPMATGGGLLQTLEFELPALFERFLARLVTTVCQRLGLKVRAQETDSTALVDATGAPYRSVRPDLVVYRAGRPVAVIDAKFKPYYVETPPGRRVPKDQRLKSGDLYQLYFYQAHLRQLHNLPEPPMALIVAPQVPHKKPLVERERRIVRRRLPDGDSYEVRLVPLPLGDILRSLMEYGDEDTALGHAGELRADLLSLVA